jgi:hypothetical protein
VILAALLTLGMNESVRSQTDSMCPAPPKSRLQVVIIGVTDFENPDWKSETSLNVAVEKASSDLSEYFEKNFQGVEVHKFLTHDQTTHDSIQQMFTNCLPVWGKNNVTLMFILSHGKAILSSGIPKDLMFMTSDTSPMDPITNKAMDAAGRAIRVSAMMQGAFLQLPRGSVLWVFLDTCNAGAAFTTELKFSADIHDLMGLKTMVLAATSPESETYKAALTRSLIDLWKEERTSSNKQCLAPPPLPDQTLSDNDPLWTKMRKIIKEEANQDIDSAQGPRTLVQYAGQLCLDTVGAQNGAIIFYNQSHSLLNVRIMPADVQEAGDKVDLRVLPAGDKLDLVPVKLRRGHYLIEVQSPAGEFTTQVVDLSREDSFKYMILSSDGSGSISNNQLAALSEKVSKFVYVMGAPIDKVVEYQKRAELAYKNAGDEAGIARTRSTIGELAKGETVGPEWSLAQDFWSQSPERIIAAVSERNYNLNYVVLGLEMVGEYKKAANVLQQVASTSLDLKRRDAFLQSAFYGYLAAGIPKEAKSIERDYASVSATISLECPECKNLRPNQTDNVTATGKTGLIISTSSMMKVP